MGAAVARIDDAQPLDALVVLGDNVYPSGDPARLDATVFRPFAAVLDHLPLYAILGNHDVMRTTPSPRSRRWACRAAGGPRHLPGDVLLVGLDSTLIGDPDQHAWLEQTLASATERWRLVAVHHPAYSAGYQGPSRPSAGGGARCSPATACSSSCRATTTTTSAASRSTGSPTSSRAGPHAPGAPPSEATTAVALGWLHVVEVAVFPDQLVVRAVGATSGLATRPPSGS